VMATLVYAWCELRGDYRHFRADRITTFAVLADSYAVPNGEKPPDWRALSRPSSS